MKGSWDGERKWRPKNWGMTDEKFINMSFVFCIFLLEVSPSFSKPFSPVCLSAAVTGDHIKHDRALSLLPHLHQSVRHLSGPAQVEVQPVLPGQWWYKSSQAIYILSLQFLYCWIMFCSLNVLCHFNSCSVPDEFMYNPVTRSYGEPHKRPEVQNSTVEFIASSDYMVNTPLIHITRTLLLCPLEGSVVFSKQRGKKEGSCIRSDTCKGHIKTYYYYYYFFFQTFRDLWCFCSFSVATSSAGGLPVCTRRVSQCCGSRIPEVLLWITSWELG